MVKLSHRDAFLGGGASCLSSPLKVFGSVLKKTGFTLAEVLITLGIIGVVAAMTLPAVITNVQKKVVEN